MTISDRAHAALAVVAAVITAASGSATVVLGIMAAFGVHISAMDYSAKTALASGGVLAVSKLIDSLNDALKAPAGGTPPAPPPAGG